MTRLSLLMGLFTATTVTGIVLLLGVVEKVAPISIIFRGTVIFFIFGLLGSFLGSFLEVLLVPITTEKEAEKLKEELKFEDDQLKAELGDLLDDEINDNVESIGTPTDEFQPAVNPHVTQEHNEGDAVVVS